MPSRAVLKKKARREAKKASAVNNATKVQQINTKSTPTIQATPIVPEQSITQTDQITVEQVSKNEVPRKIVTTESRPSREEIRAHKAALKAEAASLTRKERHRLQVQKKLEKQMHRINSTAPQQAVQQSNVDGSDVALGCSSEVPTEIKQERHDPKFSKGTFWRDRKEKKKRTLFVGNLPSTSTKWSIAELIDAVVGISEKQLDAKSCVQEVDMLPLRRGGKVVHAYVTFISKELSDEGLELLNGMDVGGDILRVNYADDKSQRAEAISKRDGSVALRGGFPRYQQRSW